MSYIHVLESDCFVGSGLTQQTAVHVSYSSSTANSTDGNGSFAAVSSTVSVQVLTLSSRSNGLWYELLVK